MHIRKGDNVQVMSGDDAGKRGTVLQVNRRAKKLVVEGVNRVFKHVRRGHPKSPQGGRLNLEMPIDVSNVMLLCPQTNKPTRVGIRILKDGSKERFARRSGASMGQVSPPNPRRIAAAAK